jgi:GNAT superfamily N-acetyltransferase
MHAGLSRPERAAFLGFAAVLTGSRGAGAGRALGEAVVSWAGEAGYRSVVTDWRATNLLSSRTWPRLGFRPTFHRLHRLVGY